MPNTIVSLTEFKVKPTITWYFSTSFYITSGMSNYHPTKKYASADLHV
jgi:hypothetical protein